MKRISATQKGLITGVLMIITEMIIYRIHGTFSNNLLYIVYSLYAIGVVWALIDYSRQPDVMHKFGAYFSEGFKCFVVVTLLMVLFMAIFISTHPEMKEQTAAIVKEELTKQGNSTPAEITQKAQMAKDGFLMVMVMASVMIYLIIGAMVTAITGAVLLQRKQYAE